MLETICEALNRQPTLDDMIERVNKAFQGEARAAEDFAILFEVLRTGRVTLLKGGDTPPINSTVAKRGFAKAVPIATSSEDDFV